MKKIAILGSTGSIGTQTLEVIRENKDIEVTGLAAGTNVDLLEKTDPGIPAKTCGNVDRREGKGTEKPDPGSGCKGCFRNGWTSGDCHDGGK